MLRSTPLADGWTFAERTWTAPKHRIGYSYTEWLAADIPGAVHLDLQRHGILPDPHARMNEIGAQWVDDRDWVYRCRFHWTPDPDRPRRVLRFEGLDTVATVSLNGRELGRAENMFLPHEFHVEDALVEGENELTILFESARRVGNERRAAYFAAHGLSDPVSRFDERAFVRKMQCAFGWDWGPTLASCGVWGPVRLLEFASRIVSLSTQNVWNDDGTVTVALDTEIEGPGELAPTLWPTDGRTVEEEPEPEWENGRTTFRPILWQPLGCGAEGAEGEPPVRYELQLDIVHAGEVQDTALRTVGFSRVELRREPDEIGESFEFVVNGRPLWVRGANWIPEMSFPGAITRDRLRERLEQALSIGCNMLRVWGGGLYESDEFYELCDELGILVWQDFPFACGYYPDTDGYRDLVAREAAYHVRRLRPHPCLALWCGNNENLQMWEQRWGGEALPEPPRYYGEGLYNEILPEIVANLDPNHAYIPSSPVGPLDGSRGVPDANGGKVGDSHYWDVWHGRGDWKYYADSDTRFSSEYGFASSCSLPAWEAAGLTDEDWAPASPTVRWHDKTMKGYETFMAYVRLHYPESVTLEDWVYYSGLNQRDAMRFGVEHFRRFAPCRGSLIWQLNDIWPTQSWALIDSEGVLKPAAHEVRRLYADRLLALRRDGAKTELWAMNDGLREWRGDVCLMAHDLATGETRRDLRAEIALAPDERRVVLTMDLTGLNTAETLVVARTVIPGLDDEFVPYDHRTWRLLVEPKEARFAPPAPILASKAEEGALTLRLTAPVVDLVLSVDGDPRPFGENALTVPKPGLLHVSTDRPIARLEARSLSGVHPVLFTRSPL